MVYFNLSSSLIPYFLTNFMPQNFLQENDAATPIVYLLYIRMITGYFTQITKGLYMKNVRHRLHELPEALYKKISAYKDSKELLNRLCGKLMLSKLLTDAHTNGKVTLADITYNECAKPQVSRAFDFNIAHSGDITICIASAGHKVGVDIEEVKSQDILPLKEHFTAREWSVINGSDNITDAFYKLWVRKEALIKATGKGVFLPMNKIEALADYVNADGQLFFIYDIQIAGGYAAAIATTEHNAICNISEIALPALLSR